jgi:hypothetical protein
VTDWLYGWAQDTVTLYIDCGWAGRRLEGLYSGQFSRVTLRPRHAIYVVHAPRGYLHLIGRIRVAARDDDPEGQRVVYLKGEVERWDDPAWPELVYAIPDSGTPMIFDRPIPHEVARKLRFDRPNDRFKFDPQGCIEPMAIVQIRRLAYKTARLLDALIDP